MIYMQKSNNVFIIGAGFSAPAQIPIQNKILTEITKSTNDNILLYEPASESLKFLIAYIKVGLYLLQNYTTVDCSTFISDFALMKKEYFEASKDDLLEENLYRKIQVTREQIRNELEKSNLQISLEDIFTAFDKSYQGREFIYDFSHEQVSDIRESIVRLFVYYFSKCVNEHSYTAQEYLDFCEYIKSLDNVVIISTNWDVLLEEYFEKLDMKYTLCLNEPYYRPTTKRRLSSKQIRLIKLHGSINWFKCLKCGTLNIVDNKKCGNYLFNDNDIETCQFCNYKAEGGMLLQSEIITPTMFKSINSQLYSNLWSAAKSDLMCAKEVTFIGYSLPIADFELRYLFQRSILKDTPIHVVLHKSDNPNCTDVQALKDLLPEKRYKDLFIKNSIDFYYHGFKEYFYNKLNRKIPKE